jgi:SagB-type dehydrogenase family enzyme
MSGVGDAFQQGTKYRPDRMDDGGRERPKPPERYKSYPGRVRIALSRAPAARLMTLDEALGERRSVREFQPEPLSLRKLGYLLWAATGVQRAEHRFESRTAPSAGALYPIETYIVANQVADLEPGVYHYWIRAHELERLRAGDLRQALAAAALDQYMCAAAPAVFVWTALFARTTSKYGPRGYRYVYLDAGHIAENLALAAVSLGLGSCQVGAFFDDEVNKLLDLDGAEESVVYMSVVGVPAQG